MLTQRPRPVPRFPLVVKKAVNSFSSVSKLMPQPVSATVMTTPLTSVLHWVPFRVRMKSVSPPLCRIASLALLIRLFRTWRIFAVHTDDRLVHAVPPFNLDAMDQQLSGVHLQSCRNEVDWADYLGIGGLLVEAKRLAGNERDPLHPSLERQNELETTPA